MRTIHSVDPESIAIITVYQRINEFKGQFTTFDSNFFFSLFYFVAYPKLTGGVLLMTAKILIINHINNFFAFFIFKK